MRKLKQKLSLVLTFLFLFGLVPNFSTLVKAEGVSWQAENSVTLVGDIISKAGLGTDWAPTNDKGLMKQYKNGVYETVLHFENAVSGGQYKVALNRSWDENYGKDGQANGSNITIDIPANSNVIFRFDGVNKKIYDSINNPTQFTTATLVGNLANSGITGVSDWNPANTLLDLDYIGGGFYKKTFHLNAGSYEYKVAYGHKWSNGEVGANVNLVVPEGGKDVTFLANKELNFVTDSISSSVYGTPISLIGTIRGNSNINWTADAVGYEFSPLNENGIFTYSAFYPNAGTYEYKAIENYSWDSGGIPSGPNKSITIPSGGKYVIFALDRKNGEIYDSVNNLAKINECLGLGPVVQGNIVQIKYIRNNKDYTDWNLWVWDTGKRNGQVDFTVENGVAVANINVAADATSVGFKVRKGTNWDTAIVDINQDRKVDIAPGATVTKAIVTEGQLDIYTLPAVNGPVLNSGKIIFYYRDNDLYRQGTMNSITAAKLVIGSNEYTMTYNSKDELFSYEYTPEGSGSGSVDYAFKITKDGQTTTVLDPMNNADGKSTVVYDTANVNITAAAAPAEVDYNQNAVVNISYTSDKEVTLKEAYIDLTAVGGPAKQQMDTTLMEQTIAVKDTTTAGEKTLPVVLVDQYGSQHRGEVKLTVKARQAVGKGDFDWDEARIYFLLTDRFKNGDTSNDDPNGEQYDKNHLESYHGGDIKGITEKLDYLKNLGINTIWITPIVDNIDFNQGASASWGVQYGYHGYWAKNFEKMDEHLGSVEDLKSLIDGAHDRDMKIMLDVVLNHTGYGMNAATATGNKNYPTQAELDVFNGMFHDSGSSVTTQYVGGLPDFATENPEVRAKIIQWQTGWLEKAKTAKGNTIDYFRVDTAKHVEATTWHAFKNALTEANPSFKMIGENFGASIESNDGQLRSGQFDSLLDFSFKGIAKNFVDGKLDDALSAITQRDSLLDNTTSTGNFLSSHDEQGFLETLNPEGDNASGYSREAIDKFKLAVSLQMTVKGQPVVYYGEELGASGRKDSLGDGIMSENRYDMPWDRVSNPQYNHILSHYQKLLSIRDEYSKLFAKGSTAKVAGGDADKYVAYSRTYGDASALVAINTDAAAKELTINTNLSEGAQLVDRYNNQTYTVDAAGKIKITIPAASNGGTVIIVGGNFIDNSTTTPPEGGNNDSTTTTVKIHYKRADGNYSFEGKNWNLWVWDKANNGAGAAYNFIGEDEDGKYTAVELPKTSEVGLIVRTDSWAKDTGDVVINTSAGDADVYITAGTPGNANVITRPLTYNYNMVNLKVHYHRFDAEYTPWNLWLWNEGRDGAAYEFNGQDSYGKVATYTFDNMRGVKEIGVIVRTNSWEKDVDADRTIKLAYADKSGNLDAYLLQKEPKIYYAENEVDVSRKIYFAKLNSFHEIAFQVNIPVDKAEDVKLMDGEAVVDAQVTLDSTRRNGTITAAAALDMNKKYKVVIPDYSGGDVTLGDIYGSKEFKDMFTYEGELGAIYTKTKTTFRVWSPGAEKVELVLYREGTGDNAIGAPITMTKGEKGVWSVERTGDLAGTFYTYKVTVNGTTNETQDIYSKAVGVNGDRSMVIDLAKTNPAGWDKDKGPVVKNQTDAIIYEVHIRDISIDPNSGIKLKGKFLGLTETGTKSAEGEATGLDHLKELGVTHIHILPSYDYASIDETKLQENKFNWGYDPKNYQTPEGSYSTDPYSGTLRVEEMKKMVKALHDAGIGVIMDSVFNHVSDVNTSSFNKTVPDYYFRRNADGTLTNGSGCGNDTASERSMYSRYMIDTVLHFAREYHIDGFRFDLMGLHDINTMNAMRSELDKVNPQILMYGEGWDMGTLPSDQRATKVNTSKLDSRIAVFSDDMRDGVKGHVFNVNAGGFANYNGQWKDGNGNAYPIGALKEQVKFGIVGSVRFDGIDYAKAPYGSQPWANQPTQTVNYVSAHDNNTLWDKLAIANANTSEADRIKMDKMANFLVLTSQGIPFIHAGEEMLRTKPKADGSGFDENSYSSPDSTNMIDWSRKSEYKDVFNYYAGLIKLRKAHPAFRMATADDIRSNLNFINTNDSTIAYTISNAANGDKWNDIAVLVNAGKVDTKVTLPKANWTVVVNGVKAGVEALAVIKGTEVTVPAGTSLVLADTESFNKKDSDNGNGGSTGGNNGGDNGNGGSTGGNNGGDNGNGGGTGGNNGGDNGNGGTTGGNNGGGTGTADNPVINTAVKVVEAIKNAPAKSVIVVDASYYKIADKSIFEAIKGTDKTVSFKSGDAVWTFYGKDIKDVKDIDLTLNVATIENSTSPNKEAIAEKVKDEDVIILSFADNGKLPGKAKVRIRLDAAWLEGKDRDNMYIYYYNETTKKVEVIAKKLKVDKDGYIEFEITHNSDYFVADKDLVKAGVLPKTGSVIDTNILGAAGLMTMFIGVLIVAAGRRKRELEA